MTGQHSPGPAGSPSARSEAAILARIALPLAAAYLAEVAMFITTKVVVGRLGYEELAAVGLAGEIAMEMLLICMGFLSIVGVFVAQSEGAGNMQQAGHAARQGLLLAVMLAAPATLAVWHLDWVMRMAGQDPRVIELARPYLHAACWFILPALLFAVLRSFVAALTRTAPVMIITVSAVGVNYVLTAGLVQGSFGLPALGVAGAGWSLTIVSWLMFAALTAVTFFSPGLRGYGLFRSRLRIDPALWREMLRLGLPVAGIVIFEGSLFLAVALLSGTFGAAELAATEILLAWTSLTFVCALGFAEATMVRVATSMGRASRPAARHSGVIGISIGVVIMLVFTLPPVLVPELIVNFFLDDADAGADVVSRLAVGLIFVVAVFQVFDGLQAIAARALRGLKDTVMPLWLAGLGYWIFGIGGGCLLAYPLEWGLAGLWWGLAMGLVVTGSLLTLRFLLLAGGGKVPLSQAA